MILVYCASGNRRFMEIATAAGFLYGAQLPHTVHTWPWFVDQDWRSPNREKYMAALARHRPHMASVMDWERDEQFEEVMSWAEEAAQYVEWVMVIPKVVGATHRIPRRIGGREVVLGYSVPTRFAGTTVPHAEFAGRRIHLLGGSPHAQMKHWSLFREIATVISADGNYAQKMALRYGQYWQPGDARWARNRHWPRLDESGAAITKDMPYEAFTRSCAAIMAAWKELTR